MTDLQPWSGFETLVDGLVHLQSRAQHAATRSVDEIMTVRNWLIGVWIVAFEQEGQDRAAYGTGLMTALARAFKARGVRGLGQSNLKNYRQIALTWPRLAIRQTPMTNIRDPNVLEFLGLPERAAYSEADLEAALVEHLQAFLLELGGDFAFLGRRYRITVGGRHHFIDLLFFHRRLRCLIAVDLKLGSFGYEDAGQMNFYLDYLRENVALEGESPPIGIVMCADKDAEEVHYATGSLDQQVFISRYLTQLPTKDQLRTWLAEERELLELRGPNGDD